MAKKVLPLAAAGIAAILLFVVVFDMVRGDGRGPDEDAQVRGQMLVDAGDKLRAAGTATVTFHADVRTQHGSNKVAWFGTTRLSYAEPPRSETEFTEVKMDVAASVKARQVSVGGTSYYSSPSFAPADRRPWISPEKTSMFWPNPLADPELGVPDHTRWQAIMDDIPLDRAISSRTEDLEDVAGAPHEYRYVCVNTDDDGCVTSFGTPLDQQYFNVVPEVDMSVWLDEEGRPRRVLVRSVLEWRESLARPGEAAPLPDRVYEASAQFELSGFGEPVAVEAPPSDQVSRARLVSAKK